MLRDLTGFDDPVELFDALDTNEKGEVGGESTTAESTTHYVSSQGIPGTPQRLLRSFSPRH